jgi:hypothetical protein
VELLLTFALTAAFAPANAQQTTPPQFSTEELPFNGTINNVTFKLGPVQLTDDERKKVDDAVGKAHDWGRKDGQVTRLNSVAGRGGWEARPH